jgi:rhodanese-related sulfurtransferase
VQFGSDVKALDRDKTYLLYCLSSRTSEKAVSLFRDLGFREVYDIFGGLNEWIRKGYPVVMGGSKN